VLLCLCNVVSIQATADTSSCNVFFKWLIFWNGLRSRKYGGMGVRKGGKNGHLPALEIETKHQDFLENMKLAAQFQ